MSTNRDTERVRSMLSRLWQDFDMKRYDALVEGLPEQHASIVDNVGRVACRTHSKQLVDDFIDMVGRFPVEKAWPISGDVCRMVRMTEDDDLVGSAIRYLSELRPDMAESVSLFIRKEIGRTTVEEVKTLLQVAELFDPWSVDWDGFSLAIQGDAEKVIEEKEYLSSLPKETLAPCIDLIVRDPEIVPRMKKNSERISGLAKSIRRYPDAAISHYRFMSIIGAAIYVDDFELSQLKCVSFGGDSGIKTLLGYLEIAKETKDSSLLRKCAEPEICIGYNGKHIELIGKCQCEENTGTVMKELIELKSQIPKQRHYIEILEWINEICEKTGNSDFALHTIDQFRKGCPPLDRNGEYDYHCAFNHFYLGEDFEPHVYQDFSKEDNIDGLVMEEKEFLREQTSETVYPLAMIMNSLDREYRSAIKSLDGWVKLDLARAFSIAKDNVDKGENYLEQFYAGVKGMLDDRPDDLGRWAASIVSDFRKKGEAGLLRGMQG